MQLVVCTAVQYAVSWSLTSLFSTNMAISETRLQYAVLEINDNVNGRGKFCTPPLSNNEYDCQPPSHHNRFTAHFPGPPGWAGARRELLDLMV